MFWLIKSLKINTFLSAAEVQYKRKCQGGLAKLTGEGGGPGVKKVGNPCSRVSENIVLLSD